MDELIEVISKLVQEKDELITTSSTGLNQMKPTHTYIEGLICGYMYV